MDADGESHPNYQLDERIQLVQQWIDEKGENESWRMISPKVFA